MKLQLPVFCFPKSRVAIATLEAPILRVIFGLQHVDDALIGGYTDMIEWLEK